MEKRSLPGSEEERLVFTDRPSYSTAEVVEIYVRREELISVHIAPLEGVAGAEIRIPIERVAITVELVCA